MARFRFGRFGSSRGKRHKVHRKVVFRGRGRARKSFRLRRGGYRS